MLNKGILKEVPLGVEKAVRRVRKHVQGRGKAFAI